MWNFSFESIYIPKSWKLSNSLSYLHLCFSCNTYWWTLSYKGIRYRSTCRHTHTYTNIHTHTHNIKTHTYTHNTQTHAQIHTHTDIHKHTQTYTHTHTHTHIHTHTYICTYMPSTKTEIWFSMQIVLSYRSIKNADGHCMHIICRCSRIVLLFYFNYAFSLSLLN